MSFATVLAWAALALWSVWGCALSQELAAGALGRFAPDLGLALLVSCAARLRTRDLGLLALVFAQARVATSIDPPLATLASTLGAVAFLRVVRGAFELARPTPLALASALVVWTSEVWLAQVAGLRVREQLSRAALDSVALPSLWEVLSHTAPGALSTALVVFVAAPLLRRLPGVPVLEGARSWPLVASHR